MSTFFHLEQVRGVRVLRLHSADDTNRLTSACVRALIDALRDLEQQREPLVFTGNDRFFSSGADLNEIAALTGPAAYEFSKMGQLLMDCIERFPAPVYAAISGYCMGGGLDLALACHHRIAAPNAIFGHRGAALGLITGWGGTQRLPRLIGKTRALQMFVSAQKVHAREALQMGLVEAVVEEPLSEAFSKLTGLRVPAPLLYRK